MEGNNYALIPMRGGREAVVDVADYDWLSKFRWHSQGRERDQKFYAFCGYGNHKKSMHRMIMGLERGDPIQVDHIDGNPLNNRRSNLRLATHAENQRNTRCGRKNKLGLKGVRLSHTGLYEAYITISKKQKFIGCYRTAAEAHIAYCYMAAHHFGEFARFE